MSGLAIWFVCDTKCRRYPDNRGYEAFCLMAFFIIHLLGVCDATNDSVY